jgi:hypothetical protein
MSIQILLALSDGKILPSEEGYKLKKTETVTETSKQGKKKIIDRKEVELEIGDINQQVVVTLAYLINLHLWTKRAAWTTDLVADFQEVVMKAYTNINILWDLLKQIEEFYGISHPKEQTDETSDISKSNTETSQIRNSIKETPHNRNSNNETSNVKKLNDDNDECDSGSDYEGNSSDDDNDLDEDDNVNQRSKKNKIDYFILKKYDFIAPNYEMTKSHNLKKLHALIHMCEYPMKFGDRSYWNTETYESSNKHNVSMLYARSSKRKKTAIKDMTNLSLLKRHLQYIEMYTNIKNSSRDSNITISNKVTNSSNIITYKINKEYRVISMVLNKEKQLFLKSAKGIILDIDSIFVEKEVCAEKMIDEISNFVGFEFFDGPKLIVQRKDELVYSDNNKLKNCNIKIFVSLELTNVTIKEEILLHGFPMERNEISNDSDYQKNSFIVIGPNTYGIINYMFSRTVKNRNGDYEHKYGATVMLLKEDVNKYKNCNNYPFKRYQWDACKGVIKEVTISLHKQFFDICFGFKFAKDNYRIVNLAYPNIINDYFILIPHTFFSKPEFERIQDNDAFSTNEHQYWINKIK